MRTCKGWVYPEWLEFCGKLSIALSKGQGRAGLGSKLDVRWGLRVRIAGIDSGFNTVSSSSFRGDEGISPIDLGTCSQKWAILANSDQNPLNFQLLLLRSSPIAHKSYRLKPASWAKTRFLSMTIFQT